MTSPASPPASRPLSCGVVRDRLVATPDPHGQQPLANELTVHLAGCPDCTRFAARLALTRQAFGQRHAGIEPGPDFSARVLAARPSSTELLGWAALRVLPAALVLVCGLTWFGLTQTPPPMALLSNPSSELLFTYAALAPSPAASDIPAGGDRDAAPVTTPDQP